MSTVFAIVVLIAIFHFVYDGIVLPSIRLILRNRLFALRDEIRTLKIDPSSQFDKAAFKLVHDGINTYLNRLPQINLGTTARIIESIKHDDQIRKKIEEREQVIKNCDDQDIKDIFYKANRILGYAFVANSGGWFIYLIPIVLLFNSIKTLFKVTVELVLLPGYYADKFISEKPA